MVTIEERHKNSLYILAAIGVTIIAAVTGLWLVWGVIVTLMFIESLVSGLRSWADGRETRYLSLLERTHSCSAESTALLQSLRTSLSGIEDRLDALEKLKSEESVNHGKKV